jgi:adenylate cyclase
MIDRKEAVRIADALSGLLFIAWFFLPLVAGPLDSYGAAAIKPVILAPWALPAFFLKQSGFGAAAFFFASWIVPLFGVWKIAAFLLRKTLGSGADPDSYFSSASGFIITCFMLLDFFLPPLAFGDRQWYYRTVPLTGYAGTVLVLAANIASTVLFIRRLNLSFPIYREYQAYKKTEKSSISAESAIKRNAVMDFIDVLFTIRAKLIAAFIVIISAILVVLITIILSGYRQNLIKAVGDGARSRIEMASGLYKVNLGDSINMKEYIAKQISQNLDAGFRFESLTIYSNRKAEIFLDQADAMPDFPAEYSTLNPQEQFPSLEALAGRTAAKWAALGRSAALRDNATRDFLYISPILQSIRAEAGKPRRDRLLGFASVRFAEEEILKPFFRTQIMVVTMTMGFLYLSIVLVYLVGNFIVNPLLFLGMSVRKISDSLTRMIRGESRVSAVALTYEDSVTTRDEIKFLSGQIGNMVKVIKGMIPYISSSTLKQSELGLVSSTKKDLAFLFTDIRGFTSLCEGMAPDQVVDILNRYLDLETEIIFENHGDIDKFVGDQMMASFDGPDKEANACQAGVHILRAMAEERERCLEKGLQAVEIGIGINSGSVVFGSVGARDRKDFTSIGDAVNLAARLEGANKAYHSKAIITETIYEKVKDVFMCRELDFIAVKGKTMPVRIYELFTERSLATPDLDAVRACFEEGLKHYRASDWKKAEACFKRNMKNHDDAPSGVFLDRVVHFMKDPPPEDWDGVFRMKVK